MGVPLDLERHVTLGILDSCSKHPHAFAWLCTRSIKIWDRSTFEVHSVVQQTDSLAPPMSWQPNGRHLYTTQHGGQAGPDRVLLYELNGLAHGGFDLCSGSGKIQFVNI